MTDAPCQQGPVRGKPAFLRRRVCGGLSGEKRAVPKESSPDQESATGKGKESFTPTIQKSADARVHIGAFPVQSQQDNFASSRGACARRVTRDEPRVPRHSQIGFELSGRGPEVPSGNPHARKGRGFVFARDCQKEICQPTSTGGASQVTTQFGTLPWRICVIM